MSASAPLIPGPDHPITISQTSTHVVVSAGDKVVADTSKPLILHEASYPPVYYLPLSDFDQDVLEPSQKESYCPYKGQASYYSIRTGDGLIEDAVWYYDEPYDAVSEIAGHAAVYPDKVKIDER